MRTRNHDPIVLTRQVRNDVDRVANFGNCVDGYAHRDARACRVERFTDGEGRSDDWDGHHRVAQSPEESTGTSGLTFVEDDHAHCTGVLCIHRFCCERTGTTLDQRNVPRRECREIGHLTAAGRGIRSRARRDRDIDYLGCCGDITAS